MRTVAWIPSFLATLREIRIKPNQPQLLFLMIPSTQLTLAEVPLAELSTAMRFSFFLLVLTSTASAHATDVEVEDIFGRRINERGIVLVDWEGEIANPAIKFFIVPPADAAFPARAVITCDMRRVYFDLPSEIGPLGPHKVVEFNKRKKLPVRCSIFGDREARGGDFVLQIEFHDAKGRKQLLRLPCHVVDQDREGKDALPIIVDFSQDRLGFFDDEKKRQVAVQAAKDWAYFFEPLPLDPVVAGDEKTFIWDPDAFKTGQHVVNAQQYTGYLLYAYGVQCNDIRSGGEPSRDGGFQSVKGKGLTIRRSGGLEIETRGNYNTNGWMVSLASGDFWKATNLVDVQNDLYSIAHHEIGHALIFNPNNPLFDTAKTRGNFDDPSIREYLGDDLKIDKTDHLDGTIDPASRRGAFGYEYHGDMPLCRWQITKLDLLCAKAIGYPLSETSAFAPLHLQTEPLPRGAVGKKYVATASATGGIPFYQWEVIAGGLPDGMKLESFTGTISGTPKKEGIFEFTLRVRDYDENATGQSRKVRVEIGPGSEKRKGNAVGDGSFSIRQ